MQRYYFSCLKAFHDTTLKYCHLRKVKVTNFCVAGEDVVPEPVHQAEA